MSIVKASNAFLNSPFKLIQIFQQTFNSLIIIIIKSSQIKAQYRKQSQNQSNAIIVAHSYSESKSNFHWNEDCEQSKAQKLQCKYQYKFKIILIIDVFSTCLCNIYPIFNIFYYPRKMAGTNNRLCCQC